MIPCLRSWLPCILLATLCTCCVECSCEAGHLPNVEAIGLCTACPAGTYQPVHDVLEAACISCPAGEQSKQVQRQGDARCTAQRL